MVRKAKLIYKYESETLSSFNKLFGTIIEVKREESKHGWKWTTVDECFVFKDEWLEFLPDELEGEEL